MIFDFREFTADTYLDWAMSEAKRKNDSPRYGSPIQLLFKKDEDEWLFNADNWNGGDVVRYLLNEHWGEEGHAEYNDSLYIRFYIIDDQTYIFILDDWDFYEISWYKQRGRTELIHKNGRPIDLEDYIELYNKLRMHWEDDVDDEEL